MNLNNIDISKLPADVRKELLKLQVMVAEKKIKNNYKWVLGNKRRGNLYN